MATSKKSTKKTEPEKDETTLALERVRAGVAEGKITTLAGIAAAIAPVEKTRVPDDFEPGLPPEVTDSQRAALVRLPEVFGKVVLTERRLLTLEEVEGLLDERETLKVIEKMAADRVEGIKETVYIGMDAEAAKEGRKPDEPPLLQDEAGFLIEARRLGGRRDEEFSREVRNGSPTLTGSDLKKLVDDEDVEFTHEDWLACTRPERVFDENKAMVLLRKRPDLVFALAKATGPGKATTSLYVRKTKGVRKK